MDLIELEKIPCISVADHRSGIEVFSAGLLDHLRHFRTRFRALFRSWPFSPSLFSWLFLLSRPEGAFFNPCLDVGFPEPQGSAYLDVGNFLSVNELVDASHRKSQDFCNLGSGKQLVWPEQACLVLDGIVWQPARDILSRGSVTFGFQGLGCLRVFLCFTSFQVHAPILLLLLPLAYLLTEQVESKERIAMHPRGRKDNNRSFRPGGVKSTALSFKRLGLSVTHPLSSVSAEPFFSLLSLFFMMNLLLFVCLTARA